MESLYSILGLKNFATIDEVRKAYLEKITQIEPDESSADDTVNILAKLKRSYDKLKNQSSKKEYDEQLHGNVSIY